MTQPPTFVDPITPVGRPPRNGILLLIWLRWMVLRNSACQAARERPLRLLGSAFSILLIWAGLYVMLVWTLAQVKRQVLEGIVATPLIFTFFFLALSAMLVFSNAILSYGGLFRRPESTFLMTTPISTCDVVILRFLESLVLASWSLILLGIPLMMAIATVRREESLAFYPLFLGLFLAFLPIPGAFGLLIAWLLALVCPKTPRRTMVLVAALLVLLGVWSFRDMLQSPISVTDWLQHFYDRIGLIQNAMLPHNWVSKGINHAMQGQPAPAAFYLYVTAANALFVSLIAVALVSKGLPAAFARAQVSCARGVRRSGRVISVIADVIFAYLPWRQRLLAAKDLKSFARDPLQWTQMAILIGLLGLYVSNVQHLWTDLTEPRLQVLIAFLNLTAVCLILATFTSRFVFPIVSLETQQLWLLGLLPLRRSGMIVAKFLFAVTITLVVALTVMGVSVYRLDLPPILAVAHLLASAAVCVGLCGVSIGMGARMPVFHERNPARIAGGFGGTVSLLLSIGLVVASLAAMGVMSIRVDWAASGDGLPHSVAAWLAGVIGLNVFAAAVAMLVGIRHISRLEC
ncbi:MAG TPA: hypothetical protein PKY77_11615 [Phycisphaerae bacterium]|nr:hypothetical protein [Phycisphaerae bacterium]HRY70521.1 hypothetical protein [Phycisphaerae bacterium]HSA27969.1 hypothetical protein [Phycisphaerae bacterium]